VDEETLRKEFEKYGKISSIKIMRNEKGVSKGFGFVCYEKQEDAQNAYDQSARIVLPNCMKPLYVAFHEGKEIRSQRLQQFRSRSRSNYQPNVYGVPYNPYTTSTHTNNPQRSNKNRANQGNQQQTQQTQMTDKDAGNKLYEHVLKLAPQNADRVTGLILNSEGISLEKIQNLINNEFELKKIVDEAQKYLAESINNLN